MESDKGFLNDWIWSWIFGRKYCIEKVHVLIILNCLCHLHVQVIKSSTWCSTFTDSFCEFHFEWKTGLWQKETFLCQVAFLSCLYWSYLEWWRNMYWCLQWEIFWAHCSHQNEKVWCQWYSHFEPSKYYFNDPGTFKDSKQITL